MAKKLAFENEIMQEQIKDNETVMAELKDNINGGNVILGRVQSFPINKIPTQTLDYLGQPLRIYNGKKWRYSDQIHDSYVGTKISFRIQFENGVVSECGCGDQQ
ncbi:MAG: hypothetical protein DF168_01926 [Candidatus Moanabacter tarae]|uniref:Uncharacterized protein n=1 Tax=Candidatus Moanibacter tarae TaxID=2200854 RepID=A0A2Z4AKD9_9BACT|nr:MAG: hypothetical protein DF168_01926 [Candidatus Moanabacter tarae]|tara:strand:- start:28636 stop:28947 length:312 start_codon:yes stop_codon:yes gene_type:complete